MRRLARFSVHVYVRALRYNTQTRARERALDPLSDGRGSQTHTESRMSAKLTHTRTHKHTQANNPVHYVPRVQARMRERPCTWTGYVRANKNMSTQVEVRSNKNTDVQGDQKVIVVVCLAVVEKPEET